MRGGGEEKGKERGREGGWGKERGREGREREREGAEIRKETDRQSQRERGRQQPCTPGQRGRRCSPTKAKGSVHQQNNKYTKEGGRILQISIMFYANFAGGNFSKFIGM